MANLPLFPNYLELREAARFSPAWWRRLQYVTVAGAVAISALLIIRPAAGLRLFWGLTVPVLPLLFMLAPGIWRNICPLAALNQTPRMHERSRARTLPPWWQSYAYPVGFSLFFILAGSRKILFNQSGPATALLILGALAAALLGGWLFKGKSGWCSSICPLLPVQRTYNQTPFALVGNSHCSPCVGCVKNCYDFNPTVANLADLYDDDPHYRGYRKLFAAAFPAFILAFFTIPNPPAITVWQMVAQFALFIFIGLGSFFLLNSVIKISEYRLTSVYGAAALNLFYWFVAPAWFAALFGLVGLNAPVVLGWAARLAILTVSLLWLQHSFRKEPHFIAQLLGGEVTSVSAGAAGTLARGADSGRLEVNFLPSEKHILAEAGRTLLEIAELNELPIEAGCRMGVCGADPIVILQGMENLAPAKGSERATLERLGLGDNCRMACMARLNGSVTCSLDLAQATSAVLAAPDFEFDAQVRQVVIIGHGIAGVTAADFIRRYHPDCEIHLIGRESHLLYNRMAITRLIYGRSAINALYLQPDSWYDEKRITPWVNTIAESVDRRRRTVTLATGQLLPYDRLVLAMGSRSHVPEIEGFGLPGTFVLREADDAIQLRAYLQEKGVRRVTIAGGGLLGLEAAYALHKMGVNVTVLERSHTLLRRQLDERGAALLHRYLQALGLEILLNAEADKVQGNRRVELVRLKDGLWIGCGALLVAAGIRANMELAGRAGLPVSRGVLVDDDMRSRNPHIFAAGDVCEFDGQVAGLWPVAVEQAKVAATNIAGGRATYTPVAPTTTLKVVGLDLTSIGRFNRRDESELEFVFAEPGLSRYRKLVVAGGHAGGARNGNARIVGAILLDYPDLVPPVQEAIQEERDVTALLPQLQAGDWSVLAE